MSFILRTGQRVHLGIQAEDDEGNPASVTNQSWAISPEGLITLEVDADGAGATVTDIDGAGVGVTTVTLTATDDAGDQETAVLDIELVAADASVFNIIPGTPEDRPGAPPPPPAEPPA